MLSPYAPCFKEISQLHTVKEGVGGRVLYSLFLFNLKHFRVYSLAAASRLSESSYTRHHSLFLQQSEVEIRRSTGIGRVPHLVDRGRVSYGAHLGVRALGSMNPREPKDGWGGVGRGPPLMVSEKEGPAPESKDWGRGDVCYVCGAASDI